MKHYIIETPRLILRDWTEDDIHPFAEMNRDNLVMEYFLKRLTEQESLDFHHRIKDEIRTAGFGLYAVEQKDNGEFIGYAGLHRITFDADFTPGIEISWRLKNKAWEKDMRPKLLKLVWNMPKCN